MECANEINNSGKLQQSKGDIVGAMLMFYS
jgi:hypothetical protein